MSQVEEVEVEHWEAVLQALGLSLWDLCCMHNDNGYVESTEDLKALEIAV